MMEGFPVTIYSNVYNLQIVVRHGAMLFTSVRCISLLVVIHTFGIPADPGGITQWPVATILPANKGATGSTSYEAKKENTNENIWNGRTSGKENLSMLENEAFQSTILQPRMLGPSDSTLRTTSFRDSLRRALTGELGTPADWRRKFTDGLRRTLSRPSVSAAAKFFSSIKGMDDSDIDDTDEDKKKPLKLNTHPKRTMYKDGRPPSPHPQAKELPEKHNKYLNGIMHNRLVEKAIRYLKKSGVEPKQEAIDEYVSRKRSLDRSSSQPSFDSSDNEWDKDLAILSGNESDPPARSPRSPDRRRPRSPEKNRSPKQTRPTSPEMKPPERDQSRSPQSLDAANEKRDGPRLNLDWSRHRSQSGVRDQKRQSQGINQQPSEQKPAPLGPTGVRQKPFHSNEMGPRGKTFYYESADRVPSAWIDRSGSTSGKAQLGSQKESGGATPPSQVSKAPSQVRKAPSQVRKAPPQVRMPNLSPPKTRAAPKGTTAGGNKFQDLCEGDHCNIVYAHDGKIPPQFLPKKSN